MPSAKGSVVWRLSFNEPLVVACSVGIAAWLVPQEFIGEYEPIIRANSYPLLTSISSYTIVLGGCVFMLASAATWLKGDGRWFGPAAIIAFTIAYDLFWRARGDWAHDDEDKWAWAVSGVYGTRVLAAVIVSLVLFRVIEARVRRL